MRPTVYTPVIRGVEERRWNTDPVGNYEIPYIQQWNLEKCLKNHPGGRGWKLEGQGIGKGKGDCIHKPVRFGELDSEDWV